MKELRTLGQILSTVSSEHEKNLIDRYFENIFYELGADPLLAKEMFQAFPLAMIRFGDTTLTREGYDDLP
ncbi:hypothetical protein EQO05_00175 [Methanosarcina sp. MSH10X1]|uniref:hypothetical protein n=1 Tax=Methanosarcina sp. MSH10X1 TaxID=2507075 RepID=UPI000FFC337A|nr:hypothetical protein [Methanosarcina sp. MSH10X1]RXA21711.1 hypothetical protein EQO05_00175 [Methanosarcina sp. MSH10X1]